MTRPGRDAVTTPVGNDRGRRTRELRMHRMDRRQLLKASSLLAATTSTTTIGGISTAATAPAAAST